MKKIYYIGIASVLSILLIASVFYVLNMNETGKVYVKSFDNGQLKLMVNNRPYVIKGMVYCPVPIGQNHTYDFWSDPEKPYILDGKMMKEMGVNTVRVYQPGNDPLSTKKIMDQVYGKYGIRFAMGHWLGFWDTPNYADPVFCEKVKKDVLDMVETYKNEKGILFWILGNENNMSFSYGPQTMNVWTTPEIEALEDPYLKRRAKARIYYSFVNEVAREIHKIDANHPVVLANAELTDIDVAGEVTPDIDILGCSVYRGKSFGSFFREVSQKFAKPVVITEFGCDRYNAFLMEEDEGIQAEFIEAEWKEIDKNTFKGAGEGNCLGGFVFEWTDEWWKFNEDNEYGWKTHDTASSWSNGAYYFDIKAEKNLNINEEWWGVCALEKKESGLDERRPVKAYFTLKNLWK
jgi:beta-galactosidase